MSYKIISVRDNPEYLEQAADYFSSKWSVGRETYHDSMKHSITTDSTLPRFYLLLKNNEQIVGCVGLITNDFCSRQDLWPWLVALYVEESERGQKLGLMMINHVRAEAKKVRF